ncbi:PAS domain S-box protein [Mucilaginibacter sp. UR6-1]|uniref:PAS domain S-box protein n=1 Tax=Mucilaginibacter sp. UR6-1 TaxID=1435643 RepID=UPI001E52076B|nr:PAS domain S-box protein [Mucilaginibacter sp. UR6-1]
MQLHKTADGEHGLIYWQNKLFATAIFYALPVSLFALVPSVILQLQEGHIYIVAFNIIALIAVALVAVNKKLDLQLRKFLIAFLIALFSIIMIASMGSFTMGCVYLFPLSIFAALQFSNRIAYLFVGLNFIICALFALIIWIKPFNLPELFHNLSLNHWLIYSVNFIFMDLVVVMLIRMLLTGLDRTMVKEAFLHKELQKELQERTIRNELLKESEEHYRTLFFQSPLPKWIFDVATLKFLQVNNAAINNYGYTEQEFLSMTLSDIHHPDKIADLLLAIERSSADHSSYTTQHVRKDGQNIHVEVRRSDILFQGKKARLVIATDITEQMKHTHAIELRNEKLQEIAYMQSHVVRVPLANIIGITDLITQQTKTDDERELYDHLARSVKQLDHVVNQIVRHAEEVLPAQNG